MDTYYIEPKILDFLADNAFDIQTSQQTKTPLTPGLSEELDNLLEKFFPNQVDGMQLDLLDKRRLVLDPKGITLTTLNVQYTIEYGSISKSSLDLENPVKETLKMDSIVNDIKPLQYITSLSVKDNPTSILFYSEDKVEKKCSGVINSFDPSVIGIEFNYDFEDSFYAKNVIYIQINEQDPEVYLKEQGFDLSEAAKNWNQENQERFEAIAFNLKAEVLGEPVIVLNNGEVACTLKELNSDKGSFKIDQSHSYYWKQCNIDNLTTKDISLIMRDLPNYKEVLEYCGVYKTVLELMDLYPNIEERVAGIKQNEPYIELEIIKQGDIERFDSLEELEEQGYSEEESVEVNQVYYVNTQEQTQRRGQQL